MVVKTFRGQLTDSSPGNQNRIRLQTNKGKVGYRIIKFEILSAAPTTNIEHVVQIWTEEQTSISATINFTDSTWMATAFESGGGYSRPTRETIIVNREKIVNQDIYIGHSEVVGATACNYYIELEVIPLDDAGAEYTTLKDMRQS